MSDELIDVVGLPEFFVDGFCDYQIIDGILRATGFRVQRTSRGEERVPLLRLVVSRKGCDEVKARAGRCTEGANMLFDAPAKGGNKVN